MLNELELKPLAECYADELYKLTDSNRAHLSKWLPWVDKMQSAKDTELFLKSSLERQDKGEVLNFLIFLSGKIIGAIGIRQIKDGQGIIGYWLSEEVQNRGIMTWACSQVIVFCKLDKKLNKIILRCSPYNAGSQSVARKCGFTYVDTQIAAEILHDNPIDLEIYEYLIN